MDSSKPEEAKHGMFDTIKSALGFGKKEEPTTYTPPAAPTSEASVTSNPPDGPALPDAFSSSSIPDASATAASASMPASLETGSVNTDTPVTQAPETSTEAPPTPIGLPPKAPAAQPEPPTPTPDLPKAA